MDKLNDEIWNNIDTIVRLFLSDTIELLDKVLDDDPADPQYSAITTCDRLSMFDFYLTFRGQAEHRSLDKMLNDFGYAEREINLFHQRCDKEAQRRKLL